MAPTVCPICRTFSTYSNNTLNVHIDMCLLSVDSMNVRMPTKPPAKIKCMRSRKPRKYRRRRMPRRLIVDIYAELERNNCIGSSSTPPEPENLDLEAIRPRDQSGPSSEPDQNLGSKKKKKKLGKRKHAEYEDSLEDCNVLLSTIRKMSKRGKRRKIMMESDIADHDVDTNGALLDLPISDDQVRESLTDSLETQMESDDDDVDTINGALLDLPISDHDQVRESLSDCDVLLSTIRKMSRDKRRRKLVIITNLENDDDDDLDRNGTLLMDLPISDQVRESLIDSLETQFNRMVISSSHSNSTFTQPPSQENSELSNGNGQSDDQDHVIANPSASSASTFVLRLMGTNIIVPRPQMQVSDQFLNAHHTQGSTSAIERMIRGPPIHNLSTQQTVPNMGFYSGGQFRATIVQETLQAPIHPMRNDNINILAGPGPQNTIVGSELADIYGGGGGSQNQLYQRDPRILVPMINAPTMDNNYQAPPPPAASPYSYFQVVPQMETTVDDNTNPRDRFNGFNPPGSSSSSSPALSLVSLQLAPYLSFPSHQGPS